MSEARLYSHLQHWFIQVTRGQEGEAQHENIPKLSLLTVLILVPMLLILAIHWKQMRNAKIHQSHSVMPAPAIEIRI